MASVRALFALILFLCPAVVHADDARAARKHFEDGSKLYDLGKFAEAAHEYELAYQAKADPALLFNIGQAYRGAGEAQPALNAYKAYLRRVPDAPNRAAVEGYIGKLEQQVAEQNAPKPAPEPTVTPTATPAIVAAAPPPKKTPVYKKWWLWTTVGAVVVAGVVVGAVVATTPKDASSPMNTFSVSLK